MGASNLGRKLATQAGSIEAEVASSAERRGTPRTGAAALVWLLLASSGCRSAPDSDYDPALRRAQLTTGTLQGEHWQEAASRATAELERTGGVEPLPFADLSRALLSGGDLEGARSTLDAGLQRHPSDLELLVLRGRLLDGMGYPRCAEVDLEKATRLAPERADLWASLGSVRLALDLPTGARAAFQQALNRGCEDPRTQLGYARALDALRQGVAAHQAYARAIALFDASGGTPSDVLIEAAKQCADGDFPDGQEAALELASAWLRRVREFDPQSAEASFLCGLVCEKRGDTRSAREALERAVEVDPLHAVALVKLGRVCQAQGELGRATEMFQRALDLERDGAKRRELQTLLAACATTSR